jgi:hypothetical protein
MLALTRREQTIVLLILFALLSGAGIRHFRMMRELPASGAESSHQTAEKL